MMLMAFYLEFDLVTCDVVVYMPTRNRVTQRNQVTQVNRDLICMHCGSLVTVKQTQWLVISSLSPILFWKYQLLNCSIASINRFLIPFYVCLSENRLRN